MDALELLETGRGRRLTERRRDGHCYGTKTLYPLFFLITVISTKTLNVFKKNLVTKLNGKIGPLPICLSVNIIRELITHRRFS